MRTRVSIREHLSSWRKTLRKRVLISGTLVALALIAVSAGTFTHQHVVASTLEAQFTDMSADGMQIVPASCAAGATSLNQCDTTTSDAHCGILSNKYFVNPSDSATLSWIADSASNDTTCSPYNRSMHTFIIVVFPAPSTVSHRQIKLLPMEDLLRQTMSPLRFPQPRILFLRRGHTLPIPIFMDLGQHLQRVT